MISFRGRAEAAATVDDVRHVAFAFVGIRLQERGGESPDTRLGVVEVKQHGAHGVLRIRPTWVRTSHPASVSIGEPQLPSWTNSQE